MDDPDLYFIITAAVLLVLLGFSAFFSASETAFSSVSRIKLKNMAAKKGGKGGREKQAAKRASLVLRLLDNYDTFLSSVLIGNNIVNIASSALATMLLIRVFGERGVSYATLIMTVLVILFGEISPKTLAKESPERTALRSAPLLCFFIFIFTPLNYLAAGWKKFIVKIFPVKTDRTVTEDELLTFVEEVRQGGGINSQEEHMIRQVIEFDDITAAEIVTPRIDLAAVSEESDSGDIDRVFLRTGFSRLPVYHENIDNIIGVILLKDFHNEVMGKGKLPREILKPVVFVTKTIKISRLLRTLQAKKSHMAVLVDEFGGTLGIVTIEDIMEELVGEIWDEHDKVVEPFRRNSDGSFTVTGGAAFQDMIDFITGKTNAAGESAPDNPETIPPTTVGNWLMEIKGGLPRAGEKFGWGSLQIEVSRIQRHRVMEITVTFSGDRQ